MHLCGSCRQWAGSWVQGWPQLALAAYRQWQNVVTRTGLRWQHRSEC